MALRTQREYPTVSIVYPRAYEVESSPVADSLRIASGTENGDDTDVDSSKVRLPFGFPPTAPVVTARHRGVLCRDVPAGRIRRSGRARFDLADRTSLHGGRVPGGGDARDGCNRRTHQTGDDRHLRTARAVLPSPTPRRRCRAYRRDLQRAPAARHWPGVSPGRVHGLSNSAQRTPRAHARNDRHSQARLDGRVLQLRGEVLQLPRCASAATSDQPAPS